MRDRRKRRSRSRRCGREHADVPVISETKSCSRVLSGCYVVEILETLGISEISELSTV